MMLFEILVVLQIQCRERHLIGQAAGCHPHVVDRPRPSALDSSSGQAAPDRGGRFVAGQNRDAGQPACQFLTPPSTPVTDLGLLGQLTVSDEGDQWLMAGKTSGKWARELAPVQQRGDISVENGRVHGAQSGQVAVTLGIGES